MAGTQSSSIVVILCLILAALMGSARGQDMTYPDAAAPVVSPDLAPAPAPDADAPTSDAGAPAPASDAEVASAPAPNAAEAAEAPAPQAEAAAAPAPGPGVDITSTAATAYRSGPPPSEPPYMFAKACKLRDFQLSNLLPLVVSLLSHLPLYSLRHSRNVGSLHHECHAHMLQALLQIFSWIQLHSNAQFSVLQWNGLMPSMQRDAPLNALAVIHLARHLSTLWWEGVAVKAVPCTMECRIPRRGENRNAANRHDVDTEYAAEDSVCAQTACRRPWGWQATTRHASRL